LQYGSSLPLIVKVPSERVCPFALTSQAFHSACRICHAEQAFPNQVDTENANNAALKALHAVNTARASRSLWGAECEGIATPAPQRSPENDRREVLLSPPPGEIKHHCRAPAPSISRLDHSARGLLPKRAEMRTCDGVRPLGQEFAPGRARLTSSLAAAAFGAAAYLPVASPVQQPS
jgi:hypothetical protein